MDAGQEREPQVVVIGAACVDTTGRLSAPMIAGTSNPGEIRISVGGVGRNIAEALGRMGVAVTLISAVGNDDWGRDMLRRTRRGGVDVREVLIVPREPSSAYLAVTNERGERVVSVDSTGIMRHIDGHYLQARRRLLAEADIVVIDGNVGNSAIEALLELSAQYGFTLAADPTSVPLAVRLRPRLAQFHLVTPDIAEAEALTEMKIESERDALLAAQAMVAAGVRVAIVTMAEQGCLYATSETSGRVPAIRTEVIDRRGAGDSLAAAVVFGMLQQLPVDESVRLGVAAAALTLRCEESVCPMLSLQALYDAMAP